MEEDTMDCPGCKGRLQMRENGDWEHHGPYDADCPLAGPDDDYEPEEDHDWMEEHLKDAPLIHPSNKNLGPQFTDNVIHVDFQKKEKK